MGWTGLTQESVHKHFPESDETQKGQMKSPREGVRSTIAKEKEKMKKKNKTHLVKLERKTKTCILKCGTLKVKYLQIKRANFLTNPWQATDI